MWNEKYILNVLPLILPLIFSPFLTLSNDFLTPPFVLSCLSRLLPASLYPSIYSSPPSRTSPKYAPDSGTTFSLFPYRLYQPWTLTNKHSHSWIPSRTWITNYKGHIPSLRIVFILRRRYHVLTQREWFSNAFVLGKLKPGQ